MHKLKLLLLSAAIVTLTGCAKSLSVSEPLPPPALKPAVSMPSESPTFLKRVEANTSAWDTKLKEAERQLKP